MKLFVGLLLFAFSGVDLVYPRIEVSSNLTTVTGEFCPETVQFTCVATDFETTLLWGFNTLSSTMFRYVLNTMDTFPLTIFDDDNVTVVILSAVQNQQDFDRADFTSTLTVSLSHLIYLDVQRVVCGAFLENEDINLMLNGVTVRAPPPRPVFTCSIADDGGSVTFNWNDRYNSNYSVNQYCVEFSTCPGCNISPNMSYVCDGLRGGQENVIIFKAINCDVQQGAAENVTISLQRTTQPPSNVEVVSLYNSSPLITNVTVKWSGDGDQYSVKCDHKSTTYIVTLQNMMDTSIEREVDSDSCENSICSASFNISEPEGGYSVSVNAVSIIGTNSTTFPSTIPANATSLLRASFEFANCITYATCSSDVVEDGNCGIRYSSISDSGSVIGMLNGPFALPLLTPDTRYDFVTNLTMNSGLTVEVQTMFVTGNFDPKLTGSNIAMVVFGSIFAVVAIVCEICGAITIVRIYFSEIFSKCLGTRSSNKRDLADEHMGTSGSSSERDLAEEHMGASSDSHNGCGSTTPLTQRNVEGAHCELSNRTKTPVMFCILISYGLSLLPVCVAIPLWISLGGVVGQQQNTCEVSWQTSRDNLTAASLFFSLLSLIAFCVFILIYLWSRKHKVSTRVRNLMPQKKKEVDNETQFIAEDKLRKEKEIDSTEQTTLATAKNEQNSLTDRSHSPPVQVQLDQLGTDLPPNGNREPGPTEMTKDDIQGETNSTSEYTDEDEDEQEKGDTSKSDEVVATSHSKDDICDDSFLLVHAKQASSGEKVASDDENTDQSQEGSSVDRNPPAVNELKIIRQPQPWSALDDIDEKVSFTVVASSENNLTFKWKLNGKTITEKSRIEQTDSPDGKSSTILVKFLSSEHAGKYKCVVKDKVTDEKIFSDEVELKDFDNELKEIQVKSLENKLSLVVAIIGKAGMGKKTLFNSLVGGTVAKKGLYSRVMTESVDDTTHVINNVNIRLVDIPVFDAQKNVAERLPENGKDVDLVIYCVSMAEDFQWTKADGEIARELTKAYNQIIWEKTVFALTFANSYGPKQEEVVSLAKESDFNKVVADYTETVRRTLLTDFGNLPKEVAHGIPILPVGHFTIEEGKTPKDCCTLPDGSNWLANLWYQSLMRIPDPQARYAFYEATRDIHRYLRDCGHHEMTQLM